MLSTLECVAEVCAQGSHECWEHVGWDIIVFAEVGVEPLGNLFEPDTFMYCDEALIGGFGDS